MYTYMYANIHICIYAHVYVNIHICIHGRYRVGAVAKVYASA